MHKTETHPSWSESSLLLLYPENTNCPKTWAPNVRLFCARSLRRCPNCQTELLSSSAVGVTHGVAKSGLWTNHWAPSRRFQKTRQIPGFWLVLASWERPRIKWRHVLCLFLSADCSWEAESSAESFGKSVLGNNNNSTTVYLLLFPMRQHNCTL